MVKFEVKQRIEKLKKEINHHRYLYHILDKQEISDAALDSLKHELFLLEQKCPEFLTSDSPSQRIGGKPLEKFKKVQHKFPMLSLNDVFNQKELEDWKNRIQKLAFTRQSFAEQNLGGQREKLKYFAELKIDGFAVSLIYKNGIFFCGSTRGDGKVGEDVTQNLKTIESIPLKLSIHSELFKTLQKNLERKIKKGILEIRGEVYMAKKVFEKINQERQAKGEPVYANPRNIAAGSIRQLDSKITNSRDLEFLAYDLITDIEQENHSEEHKILPTLGFKTDQGKICKNIEEIIDFFEFIQKKRKKLPYQIDGIVISINNNSLYKKLGVVGKAPRGSIALKFPAEEATTQVENICVQVGRTGALTPVAYLKPVNIEGITITRATLHNEDEIKKLDVRIGDTVIVRRAGDVIPNIVKVLPGLRTGKEKKFKMPKNCPICGAKTKRISGEVAVYCSNENCFAKEKEGLIHFVSRKAFNIEGLGEKIIEHLMNEGLIPSAADIFYLKKGDLEPLERFAEKSAENLIQSIEKAKKISLARFIYALGIRHVGEETARLLSQQTANSKQPARNAFGVADVGGQTANIEDLISFFQNISLEELENIQDIGPIVGKSIYIFFHNEKKIKLLKKLSRAGVEVNLPQKIRKVSFSLSGKIFVLTGSMETLSREQAKEKIRNLGGNISNSVSRNTDYLVYGENPGSKFEKAKKLEIKILNENEFLKMIK
jgi:DNA ligase (NAD+)